MSGTIPALRFKQWLPNWDAYQFDAEQQRRKPEPCAYLFSMPAVQLRSLSGVYRRKRDGGNGEGLQRFHDEKRSITIRDFVEYGYPYSELRPEVRNESHLALRKPGWLPTAIVVNILTGEDVRRGRRVSTAELVTVKDSGGAVCELRLPYGDPAARWVPTELEPLEIIDGQHRLWAFDEAIQNGELPKDFELPVVAFRGLDVGWQAYLFWSINVSPRRINPSHAFDLYPVLRSQDWLETFSELKIYREARAQEITELQYLHPQSVWKNRINMLGGTGKNAPALAGVSQAGWVRALTSTYLSPGGRGRATRGLFAADTGHGPLDWTRPQQAAFLIQLWSQIWKEVERQKPTWSERLKTRENRRSDQAVKRDPLVGPYTMLNQEQGLRGVLAVTNEVLFRLASKSPERFAWEYDEEPASATTIEDVNDALEDIVRQPVADLVKALAKPLASFDWRSSDAPNLSDAQILKKRAYRGSGGYVALRGQLLKHLAEEKGVVGTIARALIEERSNR